MDFQIDNGCRHFGILWLGKLFRLVLPKNWTNLVSNHLVTLTQNEFPTSINITLNETAYPTLKLGNKYIISLFRYYHLPNGRHIGQEIRHNDTQHNGFFQYQHNSTESHYAECRGASYTAGGATLLSIAIKITPIKPNVVMLNLVGLRQKVNRTFPKKMLQFVFLLQHNLPSIRRWIALMVAPIVRKVLSFTSQSRLP